MQHNASVENNWIVKTAVAFTLLLFALYTFLRLHIIPFYEIEIGGIEINVIDGIMKILSGSPLYTDPAKPPFDIIQYSPLYYYLVAGISKLLNISSDDPQNIYMLTRYVAFTCNVLTMMVVYFLSRRLRLTSLESILAGLFSFIYITQHYYSRGDSLYCLLFFTSVLFFVEFVRNSSLRSMILFTTTAFLCILTKQSGIIIMLTAGLCLLLKKDFRSILKIAAIFIVLVLFFVLLSGNIGGLENFYRNVVLGVKNGMSLFMLESFINDKYFLQTLFWVIAGFILSFRFFRMRNDQSQSFLLLLILSSLLFAFVTGLKIGSSLNYFIEVFTLTIIAALIFLRERYNKILTAVFYTYFLFSLAFRVGGLYSSVYASNFRHSDYNNYLKEKSVAEYLKKDLQLQKNELVYLDYRGFAELFLTGHSIFNQKDFNYSVVTYAYPEMDFSLLISGADKGLIQYIISSNRLEEVKLLGKPFHNFSLKKSIGVYNIYAYNF